MASSSTGAAGGNGGVGKHATVTPPPHFAMVEEGVYRAAYPSTQNGRYLQSLGLRTVVTLSLEALPMRTRRMLEGQGARIVALGPAGWAPRNNFDESTLTRALDIILNADHHPVLLTCATGRLQTCAVVGALRRLQGWCLASVDAEVQLFMACNKGAHHVAVLEAVECLDVPAFMAAVVQPRILAQKAAAASVQQLSSGGGSGADGSVGVFGGGSLDGAAAGGAAAAVAAANGGGASGGEPSAKDAEDAAKEVVGRFVNGPSGVSVALVAPLPLWFLRVLRHNAALARLVADPAAASSVGAPTEVHSPADGSSFASDAVAAMVRHHQQQVAGGPATGRRLPHDEFRTVALAPLISDRNAYNKADCLVDSDDD